MHNGLPCAADAPSAHGGSSTLRKPRLIMLVPVSPAARRAGSVMSYRH